MQRRQLTPLRRGLTVRRVESPRGVEGTPQSTTITEPLLSGLLEGCQGFQEAERSNGSTSRRPAGWPLAAKRWQYLTAGGGGRTTVHMGTPDITTINVSLPRSLEEFVRDQAKTGGYSSASEYIRELIREARERIRSLEDEQAVRSERRAAYR